MGVGKNPCKNFYMESFNKGRAGQEWRSSPTEHPRITDAQDSCTVQVHVWQGLSALSLELGSLCSFPLFMTAPTDLHLSAPPQLVVALASSFKVGKTVKLRNFFSSTLLS